MLRIVLVMTWALGALARTPQPAVETSAASGGDGLRLEMSFPQPTFLPAEGGISVRLGAEGMLGVPGAPDLPLVNRHVRIPDTKDVRVEVEEAHWVGAGWQTVAPLQERLHSEADIPLPWLRDEEVFRQPRPWPGDWLQVSEPMLLRQTRLVTVSIAPVRWNPVTGELLRLESLTLRVRFEGAGGINVPLPLHDDDDEGISDDGEGLVYSRPRAEDQFLRQMLGGRLIDPANPAMGQGPGPLEEISWATPDLPLNYLVFAKTALHNLESFRNWVDWKRRKGHHLVILDEGDLGSWTTSAIRNAIIDQYQNSGFPPHYVALVGDTDGTYAIPTHSSQYDHYYATISGGDILADVVVGRISVENAQRVATVFNKLLSYERSPDLTSTSWLRRAGWLTGSGHCGESMSQMARDFGFQLVLERGYMQVDTAFCANSPTWVANWFNQGISHYNYRGWVGMEGLSTSTLLAMTNPHTPIAVIFTCGSGEFAGGLAYSEAFLRAGSPTQMGGAVASMGFCTLNTHTAYNNLVDGGFWSGMLDYNIPQVGTCLFRGKLELFNTLPPGDGNISNFSYWGNLMGDPGMEMWCGVPPVLSFDSVPETLGTGAQALELVVREEDGAPVAGVAVCAFLDEEHRVLGLTDAEGRVTLALPDLAEGELHLTASKAFHVPARETVALDPQLAQPVLVEAGLQDEDGDGLLTPGESVIVSLSFHNPSAESGLPALTMTAELVDEAAAELLAGTGTLPALAPLGTAQVPAGVELRVAQTWTESLPVALNLRLEGEGQEFLVRAELPVSTPTPVVLVSAWTVQALYPGQAVPWQVRLQNQGTRAATDFQVELSFPEGSGLSATPSLFEVESLAVGELLNVIPTITADANLVPGYSAPLVMTWTDLSLNAQGEVRAPITLGNRAVTDPTGPDAHGYYAFESTDTAWTQSPTYNWVEIAPNAGGTGTVVPLPDTSDEMDASRRVELPFPFTVYGVTYTSLAVCSNGFVAFGPLAHLQTDFRNHFLPCGMGPEPMLAPMWDDHKLTGDSQVCTRYLEGQGIFVVEWYRMRTNSNNRINTFQLLLHDPAIYPTPTGDGEIVYQYHTFDDTQNNDQDFPYCTVGLKNQDATIGLTLLNYHVRPSTASAFTAGKAVRISTSIGLTIDPAALDLSPGELEFGLGASEADSLEAGLSIGNLGEAPLIWTATVEAPADWPPAGLGGRDAGGPDAFGYTWRDSGEENGPPAGWVDMWEQGTEVVLNQISGDGSEDDGYSDPIDLPFAFPFYGEPQSQVWVGANGFLSFQQPDGPYWQNNLAGIPHEDAPDRSLMVWWDDLFNNSTYQGFIRWWTNGADSLVVSWVNAPHYNQSSFGGPFTFQVVMEANGRVTYNYGDMSADDPDSDSGSIGMQRDATTGLAIRHMQISRDNISIQIMPPFWLKLVTSSGSVPAGGQGQMTAMASNHVQGLVLPEGTYTATIRLSCNDPDHPTTSIPVSMLVGDTDLGQPEGPRTFTLDEASPNPFNPATILRYRLPEAQVVTASLYNVGGQYVGTVSSGPRAAGEHVLRVDGSRLASGVYLLKLEAGPHHAVRKLVLVK